MKRFLFASRTSGKSAKSDAADPVAAVHENLAENLAGRLCDGYARQSIWLFITRQQRKAGFAFTLCLPRDLPTSKYRKGGGDRFYPVTLYMILGRWDKQHEERKCRVVWALLL